MNMDQPPTAHGRGIEAADNRVRIVLAMLAMERPTIRALRAVTGLPTTTIHGHLKALRDEGVVSWRPYASQTAAPARSAGGVRVS